MEESGEGLRAGESVSGPLMRKLPLLLRGHCCRLCREARLSAGDKAGHTDKVMAYGRSLSLQKHDATSSSTCPSRVLHHARTSHVLQELSVSVCVGTVVAGHFLLQCLDE